MSKLGEDYKSPVSAHRNKENDFVAMYNAALNNPKFSKRPRIGNDN